jgi:glycosyltransferase involved in cell wall biosynthesis
MPGGDELSVAFNAYLLASPGLRGWTRYTRNLLAALPAHGVRPLLYSTAPIHPEHLTVLPAGSFEVRVAPPMRYLMWEQLWVPRQLKADAADVFHSPMNYGLPWRSPCPRVLTLHDAIDQMYYLPTLTLRQRWRPAVALSRLRFWASRRRAHHVITVSEHAKGDLVKFLGLRPERVSVVYEAADPTFLTPVEPRPAARPYVLSVGGWEKRKNVPFLLRAFALAGLTGVDLVLGGGQEHERADLLRLAGELGITANLQLLGFVPDADLPALYAGALAFAYPSEYEGFGLQLVEAMAVGCPVLAARATSLPEILGSGGETFTLNDPGELASLLKRVAAGGEFRTDLLTRGRKRATDFSWDRAAAETAAVYRRVLGR